MQKITISYEDDFFDEFVSRFMPKLRRELKLDTDSSKDEYLTLDEAMQLAKIKSPSTFYKLRNDGLIDTFYISPRKILYSRKSIENYLEERLNKI